MTLLRVLSEAALANGFDVKTSELHGLSQRGGSVSVYIRFGAKIWSPLVPQGQANLIIALEQQEALNGLYFANKETVFLVNQHETPTMAQSANQAEIETELRKITDNINFLSASEICQKELASEVVSGVYLLGYAAYHNFLPIKPEIIKKAIKKTMSEKHWEINFKALDLDQRNIE